MISTTNSRLGSAANEWSTDVASAMHDTIADSAVSFAKRNSEPEVRDVHLLLALLNDARVADDALRETVDAVRALEGAPGDAITTPTIPDGVRVLLDECDEIEGARRVARRLLDALGIAV